MARQLQLGWKNPRPNDFQGPDLRPLRDLFANLQQHLSWPFVWLTYSAGGAQPINPIPFTVTPGYDASSLYRTSDSRIMVPRDFSTYLAVGAAEGVISTVGGTAAHTFGWRVDGVPQFFQGISLPNGAGWRLSAPIMLPVTKGQTMTLTTTGNGLLDAAKALVVFVPLAN